MTISKDKTRTNITIEKRFKERIRRYCKRTKYVF